jgi:hypothetical protein
MADRARSFLIKFLGDSKSLSGETDAIVGRFGKIKAAVGEADGFFGKLKAGGGAALQSVGGAGAIAAAGVTAVAAAAAKGLHDFEKLGVEIGKGAEATGLSTEAYSRWKEVADDAGISAGTLEGTIGKFNKTIGTSPDTLAKFGVEIAKAADGTTDVNATFLNAIDTLNGIKDPTEQAEAATKLFGRSWQEMSELIGRGSPQLRKDLAAVDDSKVFDDKKVADARKLRDAFDSIQDAAQSLFLTLGQSLAPVVADLAPKLAKVVAQIKPLAEGLGKLTSGVLKLTGPLLDLSNTVMGKLATALGDVIGLIGDGVGAIGDWIGDVTGASGHTLKLADNVLELGIANATGTRSVEDLAAALKDQAARQEYVQSRIDAYNGVTDDATEATSNYGEALASVRTEIEKARDALSNLIEGNLSSIEAQYAFETSAIQTKNAVDDYTKQVESGALAGDALTLATESMRQKMVGSAEAFAAASGAAEGTEGYVRALITSLENQAATLDPNSPLRLALQGYIDQLKGIPGVIEVDFRIKGDSVVVNGRQIAVPARKAKGGRVRAGEAVIVGDNPDGSLNATSEMFVADQPGMIVNADGTARAMAGSSGVPAVGGGSVHVHIEGNVYGVDAFERAIVDGVSAAFAERERQARGNR